MSSTSLDEILERARAQGLLPADAKAPTDEGRPWPVVLLTALGAWLAALPMLGVVGMLLGDLISRSVGPYLVGTLLLAGAIVVLRSRDLPLFLEQLAVPALLVGGGSLGFGLFRDAGTTGGALLLGVALAGPVLGQSPAVSPAASVAPPDSTPKRSSTSSTPRSAPGFSARTRSPA